MLGKEEMYSGKLYHYTSVEGVKGIIGKNELKFWLTHENCLNDSNEGQHIESLYYECLEEMKIDKSIDTSFYKVLKKFKLDKKQIIQTKVESENNGREGPITELDCPECDAYFVCFSKDSNSLPMWNYYSKGDCGWGYNLGFDSKMFETREEQELREAKECNNINKEKESINSVLREVIYDEKLKKI